MDEVEAVRRRGMIEANTTADRKGVAREVREIFINNFVVILLNIYASCGRPEAHAACHLSPSPHPHTCALS